MSFHYISLGLVSILAICQSFAPSGFYQNSFMRASKHHKSSICTMVLRTYIDVNEVIYPSVAVSGFVSKSKNFAEAYPFSKLYEKRKYDVITVISDDISFARKRLVSRDTVYSGLMEVLNYEQATDDATLEKALNGKDAWLHFNISTAELIPSAKLAINAGVKRVVFGVQLTASEYGPNNTFEEVRTLLSDANVTYSIFKFGEVLPVSESRHAYRIAYGNVSLPVPSENIGQRHKLSTGDLYRIVTESVDLMKSFNDVRSVGPGTDLDLEMLVFMKSKGWSERAQVTLMMGDKMQSIEEEYGEWREQMDTREKTAPKQVEESRISSTGFSL